MRYTSQRFFVTWLMLAVMSVPVSAENINVYSYHIDPPFHLPNQKVDLSKAFIAELNQWQQHYNFTLVTIKRPQLNAKLLAGESYLILWANPIWFKSKDKNVQASEGIFWDADIWLSMKGQELFYHTPEDLLGKNIGVRDGYFYKGITPLIAKGKINANANASDHENYLMLRNTEIDAFVMSRSSFLYWKSTQLDVSSLNASLSPHDAFKRHILLSEQHQKMIPMLNEFIDSLTRNNEWNRLLKKWGIQGLVEPIELDLHELMDF